jgi:hypothetical protein
MRNIPLRLLFTVTALAIAFAPDAAFAGSGHFNYANIVSTSGNTITVDFKESGLGDITSVHIQLTGTAVCLNGGGKHPSAGNKTGFASGDQFPVHNGTTGDAEISATASFSPSCSPPMTVEFTSVKLCDVDNAVCKNL